MVYKQLIKNTAFIRTRMRGISRLLNQAESQQGMLIERMDVRDNATPDKRSDTNEKNSY